MERVRQQFGRFVPAYYVASALLFVVAAQLARLWTLGPDAYQPFFPAVGATVAVALTAPRRYGFTIATFGAAVGALVCELIDHRPDGHSVIVVAAFAVEAAISYRLAQFLTRRIGQFSVVATMLWLVACLAATTASALIAIAAFGPDDNLTFVLDWVLAHTLGIYVVGATPLAFRALETLSSDRFAISEVRIAVTLLALATVGAFATTTSVAYVILPMLTWVCIRGGTHYGLPSALAIVIYACALTSAGYGPFADDTPGWFTPLTGFITAVSVSAAAMNLFAERAELRRIQMNAILSAIPDAVVVVDRVGRVVASNAAGQPVDRTIEHRTQHPLGAQTQRSLPGNNSEMDTPEVDIRTTESTGRIIESRRVDVGDGTQLSVVRDITDLVEMARQLDASENRWRRIIEAAREGIVEIDDERRISYASERFGQIVGRDPAGLIGTHVFDMLEGSSIHAGVRASVIARSGSLTAFEAKLVTATGAARWVLLSASPQLDDDGELLCSTVFVTDITELKSAEVERIEMTDQLADVESSEQQRLACDLHDGPLQDLTAVQLILSHLATKDGPDADLVNKAADAMVDALIALRTGVHALEPVDVMNGSLAEALQRHAIRARGASDIDVEVRQVGSPPLGSQAQVLYRIGREAITNAARHAVATTIRVSITGSDGQYVLRVADDGRGFAGDLTPLTGHIGLRSIRERARRARGSLDIESSAGLGTVVEVTLPAELDPTTD